MWYQSKVISICDVSVLKGNGITRAAKQPLQQFGYGMLLQTNVLHCRNPSWKTQLILVTPFCASADDGCVCFLSEWYLNGNYLVVLVSVCVIFPLALMKQLGEMMILLHTDLAFPISAFSDNLLYSSTSKLRVGNGSLKLSLFSIVRKQTGESGIYWESSQQLLWMWL